MSEETIEATKFNQIFDLSVLKMYPNDRKQQREIFVKFYQECVQKDLAPFISDFIIEGDSWGCLPMIIIAESEGERVHDGEPLLKFKLRVLCDKWGQPVKCGDIVVHSIPSKAWKGASPVDETRARQMGKYEELFRKHLEYKVDERGCISVPFHTASYFIQQFGVHSKTGLPITKQKRILPEQIPKKRNMPEMGTLHYWRYSEVTEEQYSKLPIIKK